MLRAEGRPPAELAEHLRHGARRGDAAAIRELRAAAEEMTATAPSAAADLMLRALELAHPGDVGRSTAPLVAGAVRLLASAGRLGEARELADRLGVPLSAAEEAGSRSGWPRRSSTSATTGASSGGPAGCWAGRACRVGSGRGCWPYGPTR